MNTDDPTVRQALGDFAGAAGLAFDGEPPRNLDREPPSESFRGWAEEWAKQIVDDVEFSANAFAHVQDMALLWKLREQVRKGISSLKLFEDEITGWLLRLAGNAWDFEIDGVGPVQRRSGTKRTRWDHDLLFSDIYRVALETPNGDLPPEERVLEAVRSAAGVSYWRTGQLKKWGLDPAEYSTSSPGKPTIELSQ